MPPKQIIRVQTIISEHERNGAKWEVGHIAIYLTKGGWGWGTGAWCVCAEAAANGKDFWEHRSDSVCLSVVRAYV